MAGILILAGMIKLAGLGVAVGGRDVTVAAGVAAPTVAVAGARVGVGVAVGRGAAVLVGAAVGSVGPVGKGVTGAGIWVESAPFSKLKVWGFELVEVKA